MNQRNPFQFTQISGSGLLKGLDEDALPWAQVLGHSSGDSSSEPPKVQRIVFGQGHVPVPVMLSVITLVAILLYFLAQ